MANPTTAAGLLLTLYELRTEHLLRAARSWFVYQFHPTSADDVLKAWLGPGPDSAPFRMVTSYWDMAASLVLQEAIPAPMFNEANSEHVAVFAKLRTYLPEVREKAAYPDYLMNLEGVVNKLENASERIAIFDRYLARQQDFSAQGKQRPSTAEA